MSAVWFRARAVLLRRWRAWAGLGIVLGIFAGFAIALAQGAIRTRDAYPRFVRDEHAADLVIAGRSDFGSLSLVGSVDLAAVEGLPDVVYSARAFAALPFSAHVDGGGRALGAADLLPVASQDHRLGRTIEGWKMLEGREADPGRVGEATASFELARRLHLHVGSNITFRFYETKRFLDTAGSLLAEWPRRMAALRTGSATTVTDPADGPVVTVKVVGIEASPLEFPPLLTDLAPVLHLTPAFHAAYDSEIVGSPISYVHLSNRKALRNVQLAVEQLSPGKPVSFISTLNNQEPKVQRSVRAEALVLAILGGLVAFAGAVALGQALVRQSVAEAGEDDTLRALGMARPQLLGVAGVRAAVVAAVAVGAATVVAWLATPHMLLSLARRANLEHGFPVTATVLALGLLALVVFTFAASGLGALLASRRHTPGAAERERATGRRVFARLFRLPFVPLSALLGMRFAVQRARRSAHASTAVVGIALCIAILAFASTFTAHLHRDLSEPRRYGWNWDLKIGAPALPDIAPVITPELRKQSGLTDLSVGAVTQIDVGPVRVDVLGLDPVVGNAVPTVVSGRAPSGKDEVVLGARTIRMLHTGLGRIIAARIGATKATYRVVGQAVFPEFGDSGQLGTGAWMTVAGVHQVLPSAPRDSFLVRIHGPDAGGREARLAEMLSPLPVHDEARPEDLVNLAHGDGLISVLVALLALLALAMLIHTTVTSVRTGRRTHATLRALGYSRGQTRVTVLWQTMTLALVAAAIGVPLGIASGRWVWTAFATHIGLPSDPYVPVATVVAALAGAALLGLVASVPPAWIASRARVDEVLRAGE